MSTLSEFQGRIPEAMRSAEGSQEGQCLPGVHAQVEQVCKGEAQGPDHQHLSRSSQDVGKQGMHWRIACSLKLYAQASGRKVRSALTHTPPKVPFLLPTGASHSP